MLEDSITNGGLNSESPSEEELDELLRRAVRNGAITPLFQPIIDLAAGTVYGYEVVARAIPPLEMPGDFLPRARKLALAEDLEELCLRSFLQGIQALPEGQRKRCRFFLNVSEDLLARPRISSTLDPVELRSYGIDVSHVVLEITESPSDKNFRDLEETVRLYTSLGFRIAIDDFGLGHESLTCLSHLRPQFIKFDREFLSGIHVDEYKQHFLKSILDFSRNVGSRVITEGVENWEELETLIRIGVRFVQGYLFGRAEKEPLLPNVGILRHLQERIRHFHSMKQSVMETVADLVISFPTMQRSTSTVAHLKTQFLENPHLDHVVIIDGFEPVGMVTRQHFFSDHPIAIEQDIFLGSMVDGFMQPNPLIVSEDISVTVLARRAMDRPNNCLYDPVLVTDAEGHYVGSVTMRQLITRSFDVEVRRARELNPLTNLPGNRPIQEWLGDVLTRPYFFVIYGDLNRFKEYNDAYGFSMGDKMIQLAARVLSYHAQFMGDMRLGHLGGDDFVLVATQPIEGERLLDICETFDEWKLELFSEEHREKGYFDSIDRRGNRTQVPLVTISLAIIHGEQPAEPVHLEMLAQQAASLKRKVKELASSEKRSTYLLDRRAFPQPKPDNFA